jgi:hypothetical protein
MLIHSKVNRRGANKHSRLFPGHFPHPLSPLATCTGQEASTSKVNRASATPPTHNNKQGAASNNNNNNNNQRHRHASSLTARG